MTSDRTRTDRPCALCPATRHSRCKICDYLGRPTATVFYFDVSAGKLHTCPSFTQGMLPIGVTYDALHTHTATETRDYHEWRRTGAKARPEGDTMPATTETREAAAAEPYSAPTRTPSAPASSANDGLTAMIVAAVAPEIERIARESMIDVDALEARVTAAATEVAERVARENVPTRIEVMRTDGTAHVVEGIVHPRFEALLRLVSCGLNVYLYGPAGTGKTHAADAVSQVLYGRGAVIKSMGPTDTSVELLGFTGAGGTFVPGVAYEPVLNGGVLVLDEMDRSSADGITCLNSLLANGQVYFPGIGMVERHAGNPIIATGNTIGHGREPLYPSAQELDGSTLNRFFSLRWDYDTALESQIVAGMTGETIPAGSTLAPMFTLPEDTRATVAAEWAEYVQRVRRAAADVAPRAVIAGTRDIIDGTKAIMGAGFTLADVADMRFWNKCTSDDRARIERAMGDK